MQINSLWKQSISFKSLVSKRQKVGELFYKGSKNCDKYKYVIWILSLREEKKKENL